MPKLGIRTPYRAPYIGDYHGHHIEMAQKGERKSWFDRAMVGRMRCSTEPNGAFSGLHEICRSMIHPMNESEFFDILWNGMRLASHFMPLQRYRSAMHVTWLQNRTGNGLHRFSICYKI